MKDSHVAIPGLERAVSLLLHQQAEALDDRRWSDFINCFMPDGRYWMPGDPSQLTWDGTASIFSEDRDLMEVRHRRLEHPNAWSMAAAWGTSHVVSGIRITDWDLQTAQLQSVSRFMAIERRRDDLRTFAGRYTHDLQMTSEGLKIRLQRVDLLGPDRPFEYVLQAWL